jgi:hypothetical protein
MPAEKSNEPVKRMDEGAEQPAWYDFLIDIFKKLLQLSNFSYGTKKDF